MCVGKWVDVEVVGFAAKKQAPVVGLLSPQTCISTRYNELAVQYTYCVHCSTGFPAYARTSHPRYPRHSQQLRITSFVSHSHTLTLVWNAHVHTLPSPQVTTVGADSFIAKPVSGDTLTEAIRDYAVQVAPALPVVTNDDDQNPQGQTPVEVPPRHLEISADLMFARNE